jgi:hypothetical protein
MILQRQEAWFALHAKAKLEGWDNDRIKEGLIKTIAYFKGII